MQWQTAFFFTGLINLGAFIGAAHDRDRMGMIGIALVGVVWLGVGFATDFF